MEQNKKILIIEDDTNMREALVRRFTAEHFTAKSASDGPSGLAVALREKPDIILLDIMMPGFDGMALMKNLRQTRLPDGQEDEWGKHVPIILLTSLSADEGIMKGIIRDEPAYYIVKDNVSLDDVVEKVKERLERV